MILNLFRVLLLITLLIVIVIDVNIPLILNTPTNQLIIGIIIIFTIIVVDEIIGFLLGVIFLVIYFKYYQKLIDNKNQNNDIKQPLLGSSELSGYNFKPFSFSADTFTGDSKPVPNNLMDSVNAHYVNVDEKNNCITMPYISTELLESAQNNIFDVNNYKLEIKNDDKAYGIQGLNSDNIHYLGFDKTTGNNLKIV